jgi:hypothetical protein
MKMNEKMVVLLTGAALCGFFFSIGERRGTAAPVNCVPWPCKDIYCWWVTGSTDCSTCQVTGSPAPPNINQKNTTNAIPDIFAAAAVGSKPLIPSGKYDRYTWSIAQATCNKVKGVDPSPQETTPAGTVKFDINATRNLCTQP